MEKFSDVQKLKNLVDIAARVNDPEFSDFKNELNSLYSNELESFLAKTGAGAGLLDKIKELFGGPKALTDEEIERNLRPDTKGVQNVRPIPTPDPRERTDISAGPDRSDLPFGVDRDTISDKIGPTPATRPVTAPPSAPSPSGPGEQMSLFNPDAPSVAPGQLNLFDQPGKGGPAAPSGGRSRGPSFPTAPRGPVPGAGPASTGPGIEGRSLTDRIKAVRTALSEYRDYVKQNVDQFDPKYLRSVETLLNSFNKGVQAYENPQPTPDISEAPTQIIPSGAPAQSEPAAAKPTRTRQRAPQTQKTPPGAGQKK